MTAALASTHRVDEVLTYIKRQFGDEDNVQITDADIISWVNEAQEQVVFDTKCIEGKASTTITAGVYEYEYPSSTITDIISVRYKGVPITQMQFAHAEQNIIGDDPERLRVGRPQIVSVFGDFLTFWPTPDETVTDGLTIFYLGRPKTVTLATDLLSIPDRYYTAFLALVMSKAYELDEDYDAQRFAIDRYQAGINKLMGDEEDAMRLFYPVINLVED